MDNAPSTLFYLFENDLLPAPGGQTAFLNAQFHPALESLKKNTLALQQHFKPDAQDLQQRGFSVSSAINLPAESQDHVMLVVPKNAVESLGLIAQALVMLKPGGTIICAGDNKAGGARLKNNLQLFGLKNIQEESKNKARVAWATKENLNQNEIDHALKAGAMQFVLDESFVSMPGISAGIKSIRAPTFSRATCRTILRARARILAAATVFSPAMSCATRMRSTLLYVSMQTSGVSARRRKT